jgi:hypothetical protein
MDLLFASDSPFNWAAEENFARLKLENPQIVAVRGTGGTRSSDSDNGATDEVHFDDGKVKAFGEA